MAFIRKNNLNGWIDSLGRAISFCLVLALIGFQLAYMPMELEATPWLSLPQDSDSDPPGDEEVPVVAAQVRRSLAYPWPHQVKGLPEVGTAFPVPSCNLSLPPFSTNLSLLLIPLRC